MTYAWTDNRDDDVDSVASQLDQAGLTVTLDRRQLIPGQPIWPQIDAQISNPVNCDAWAVYVTEHSLSSPGCKEELNYALDRALQRRAATFPIIGIFPSPIDPSIVPAAIRTRLYVNLRDPNWIEQVVAGAEQRTPNPAARSIRPYRFILLHPNRLSIEIRPRAGLWCPSVLMVPAAERDRMGFPARAPSGNPPIGGFAMSAGEAGGRLTNGVEVSGWQFDEPVDPNYSIYCTFSSRPSLLVFGPREQPIVIDDSDSIRLGGG